MDTTKLKRFTDIVSVVNGVGRAVIWAIDHFGKNVSEKDVEKTVVDSIQQTTNANTNGNVDSEA